MLQLKELLAQIAYLEVIGEQEKVIKEIVPLDPIQQHVASLCWCADKNQQQLRAIHCGTVICSPQVERQLFDPQCTYILVEQPRHTFREVLKLFVATELQKPLIAESAKIAPDADIAASVQLGEHVVIEAGVKVGERTRIGHNTVVMARTQIGCDVVIGCNNTLGNVGFGYERNAEGVYEVLPHLGNVVIEDHVEIGNNTCIDRAVIGSTRIRRQAKIDNLVHIAHGVDIGENALVIANAMVAGSVKVGANAWVAPSSAILNQKSVGADATIGLGAVVIRDVPAGDVVVGNPAKSIRKPE